MFLEDIKVVDYGDSKVNVKPTLEYRDFWDMVSKGKWEKNTLLVIAQVLEKGGSYVDIGAWIGPTIFKAARFADKIIAFEPDPISSIELEDNIKLNNFNFIELHNVALFNKNGEMNFGGGGSGKLGMSVSTLMSGERGLKVIVRDIRQELEKDDFFNARLIKIDTEGAEYTIIPHIKDFLFSKKPNLLLSCHSRRISGDLGFMGRIRHFIKRCTVAKILSVYRHKYIQKDDQWIEFSKFQFLKFVLSPRKNCEFFVSSDIFI
jgi:FkbM family methyltransferase